MSHNIDLRLRKRLVKSLVWSGRGHSPGRICSDWRRSKMWCWRKLLVVSWRDRVLNKEVASSSRKAAAASSDHRETKEMTGTHNAAWWWLDDHSRKKVDIHGKHKTGRPCKGFLDDLITECGATGNEMLKRMALARDTLRDTSWYGTMIGSLNLS